MVAGVGDGAARPPGLTESPKSLGYRAEYWIGAWGVITDGPRTWLTGHGPGNFSGPYVRHKLPRSSEEILDPHNLVLEVWATAGAGRPGLGALALALGETLGPARPSREAAAPDRDDRAAIDPGPETPPSQDGEPPAAGLAAWPRPGGGCCVASVVGSSTRSGRRPFLPLADPGRGLGGSRLLGLPLWRRRPIAAAGLGAAVLGVAINLLAAGGIGIPRWPWHSGPRSRWG